MFLLLSNIMESPCKKLKLENHISAGKTKTIKKQINNIIIKPPRFEKRRNALWNIFEIK